MTSILSRYMRPTEEQIWNMIDAFSDDEDDLYELIDSEDKEDIDSDSDQDNTGQAPQDGDSVYLEPCQVNNDEDHDVLDEIGELEAGNNNQRDHRFRIRIRKTVHILESA